MQKITPFLWFNDNAEEAMEFYASVFKDSKILNITRLPDNGMGPEGKSLVASFKLYGQEFMALNGGPHFKFTEAISFVINCDNQKEVDYFWDKLISDGGQPSQCGWLKDKFGLSWQVVPVEMPKLLDDKNNPGKAKRAMDAMMKMQKLDIDVMKKAYDGK